MKITCPQDNLSKGLAIVSRAVSTRSTMPILSNILLSTDGNRLRLAATNLELSVNCWIEAEIEEEGKIAVPARLLQEFVSSLPNAPVSMVLNQSNRTLQLKCLRTEGRIKGVNAEEFPAIPTVEEGAEVYSQPAHVLKDVISQVAIAAASDDSRPIFTGVLTTIGQTMSMVAADGFRLGLRSTEIEGGPEQELTLIIPARSLVELARILPDGKAGQEELVEIAVTPNKNQVIFRTSAVELVSRLIEGQFPNYKQIMPKEWKTQVVVPTSEFLNAAKTASFFARDSANIVRLHMESGEMTVRAESTELGDNESRIDAIVEGQQQADIAFNAKYLTDALNVVDSEQIKLEITSAGSPGVIKPVDSTDYVHIIMPMATSR
ncbi:MAG TPA: DNA polymerase III subunit beta [Chloroflexota bacterium]|nr:DNA polymerase III subunit beta [Chloroflexota bacterium]